MFQQKWVLEHVVVCKCTHYLVAVQISKIWKNFTLCTFWVTLVKVHWMTFRQFLLLSNVTTGQIWQKETPVRDDHIKKLKGRGGFLSSDRNNCLTVKTQGGKVRILCQILRCCVPAESEEWRVKSDLPGVTDKLACQVLLAKSANLFCNQHRVSPYWIIIKPLWSKRQPARRGSELSNNTAALSSDYL